MHPILEHKHYIIRAEIENSPILQDLEMIENWMTDVISAIDMKILIPPAACYCDKEKNKGVTAIAAIETSHMALHIWDEIHPAVMQFDLYSCKHFEEQIVVDMIGKTFNLVKHASIVLDRDPFIIIK